MPAPCLRRLKAHRDTNFTGGFAIYLWVADKLSLGIGHQVSCYKSLVNRNDVHSMKSMNKNTLLLCLVLGYLVAVVTPAWPQATSQVSADNTKVNKQDNNNPEPTADQQKNNRSDLQIARQIRQSLSQDKSLSTYAHNVKVISENGKVTLKGPVRSEDEKQAVLSKAAQIAGENNVNDKVTVAPKRD